MAERLGQTALRFGQINSCVRIQSDYSQSTLGRNHTIMAWVRWPSSEETTYDPAPEGGTRVPYLFFSGCQRTNPYLLQTNIQITRNLFMTNHAWGYSNPGVNCCNFILQGSIFNTVGIGGWHQVAVVVDNLDIVRYYKDGSLLHTWSISSALNENGYGDGGPDNRIPNQTGYITEEGQYKFHDYVIGNAYDDYTGPGNQHEGHSVDGGVDNKYSGIGADIEEFHIYTRALSDSEIRNMFLNFAANYDDTYLGNSDIGTKYHMDEGMGSVLGNLGFGEQGIIYNCLWIEDNPSVSPSSSPSPTAPIPGDYPDPNNPGRWYCSPLYWGPWAWPDYSFGLEYDGDFSIGYHDYIYTNYQISLGIADYPYTTVWDEWPTEDDGVPTRISFTDNDFSFIEASSYGGKNPTWYTGSHIFDNMGYTWTVVLPFNYNVRRYYLYPDPLPETVKVYYHKEDFLDQGGIWYPEITGSGSVPYEVNSENPDVMWNAWPSYGKNDYGNPDSQLPYWWGNEQWNKIGRSIVTEVGEDSYGPWFKLRPVQSADPGSWGHTWGQLRVCGAQFVDVYRILGGNNRYVVVIPWGSDGSAGDPPTDDNGGRLFVADTDNGRIFKRKALDLSYVSKVGHTGFGNDAFDRPYFVDSDRHYIFIADTYNHRIIKRSIEDMSYLAEIGTEGIGVTQFNLPKGITNDGNYVYIVDSGNNRISKRFITGFTPDDDFAYASEIGTVGSGNDNFNSPSGITNDGTYLYVVDTGNNRIVKRLLFDLSYVSEAGSWGGDYDNFNAPTDITCDGTYLYISDTGNNRIVKRLASDLSYDYRLGTIGSGNDNFDEPCGLTNDGTYLYVVDSNNHRIVKRMLSDLSYVDEIGTEGTGNDQFDHPIGIAYSIPDSTPPGTVNFPDVTTFGAKPVYSASAVLNGEVNPNNLETSVWFEYGTDPTMTTYFSTTPQSVGSGGAFITVSELVEGLTDGTVYFHRIAANNLAGELKGAVIITHLSIGGESGSISASLSRSASFSPSSSFSPSASVSPSASFSPSASVSPSASKTPSASVSPSISPSASVSPSLGGISASGSISPSASASKSVSSSATPSPSVSPSSSASASKSPSASKSLSISPSASFSPSPSPTGEIFLNTLFHFYAISGGTALSLDSIDGESVVDGDRAFVMENGSFAVYYLDAYSGEPESLPMIVAPDTNAGNKRWIRCT